VKVVAQLPTRPASEPIRAAVQPSVGVQQISRPSAQTSNSPHGYHKSQRLPPFSGNVQATLDRLAGVPHEQIGPQQAVQLARASADCMNHLSARDAVQALEARQLAGDKSEQTSQLIATYKAMVSRDSERCAGYSMESFGKTDAWLEWAATQGDPAAQLEFAVGRSLSYVADPSGPFRNPEKIVSYRQQAMRYLESLSASGNADALLLSSIAYADGILTQKDPVKAYAYQYAHSKGKNPTLIESDLASLSKGLSSAEVAEARAMGERIWQKCCGR
jgi:hypothetical protein